MPTPTTTEKPRRLVMKLHGEAVAKGYMRSVPLAAIKIDPGYQRDTNQTWVADQGAFDANQAATVVLSSREGGPYCIDGGHRVAIARASGATHVNAFVIDRLTKSAEAALFVKLNRARRALKSFDLFKAELAAPLDFPETTAMVRVVTAAGFQLAHKAGSPRAITAIDSVRYIFRYGGADLLSRTLALVGDLWIGEDKALSGPVLKGLALFLFSSGQQTQFKRERLVKVMQLHGPYKVGRLAQVVAERRNSVTAGPANFAEAILEEYNKLTPKGEQQLPPLTIGSKKRPAPYRRGGSDA